MDYRTKIAQRIVDNEGGLVTGAAGTWKIVVTQSIKQQIIALTADAAVVTIALTHVAARIVCGQTARPPQILYKA